jgi:hypothetical protein
MTILGGGAGQKDKKAEENTDLSEKKTACINFHMTLCQLHPQLARGGYFASINAVEAWKNTATAVKVAAYPFH